MNSSWTFYCDGGGRDTKEKTEGPNAKRLINNSDRPAAVSVRVSARRWCLAVSVTRWLYNFWLFGHLQQRKIALEHKIIAKVGSNFFKTLNKALKNCLRPNFCLPKWRFLPNLVTLLSVSRTAACHLLNYFTLHVEKVFFEEFKFHISQFWCQNLNQIIQDC